MTQEDNIKFAKDVVFMLPFEAKKFLKNINKNDDDYIVAQRIVYMADFMCKDFSRSTFIEKSLSKIKTHLLEKEYKEAFDELENAISIDVNYQNQTPLFLGNSMVEILSDKLEQYGIDPQIMTRIFAAQFS